MPEISDEEISALSLTKPTGLQYYIPLQGRLSSEKTLNSNHEYHPSDQAANPEI